MSNTLTATGIGRMLVSQAAPLTKKVGGGGAGDDLSEEIVDAKCVDALKKAGLWDKILKKDKNPGSFIDVNTIEDEDASKYFGSEATGTAGTFFDNFTHAAHTFIGRKSGKTGIYSRGGRDGMAISVRLHELAHLSFPYGRNLDISLANKLRVKYKKGKNGKETGANATKALSTYFNGGCDPTLLRPVRKRRGRRK